MESEKNDHIKEKTLDQKKEELFIKLQKDWNAEEFVQFNEFTIQEKLQKHAFVIIQWQQKLDNERFQLEKLKELLDRVQGEAFERIQRENDISLRTSEIEKYYLPRDSKTKKVKEALLLQSFIVSYFETSCKAINSMNWSMKNFTDQQKL